MRKESAEGGRSIPATREQILLVRAVQQEQAQE